MIIALEGPDRSGKTTLLKPLAAALNAQAITRLPTSPEASRCWHHVEPIYLHLLEQLMDLDRLYVTDRSMTVSAQVYSRVFDRPLLFDPEPWYSREVVVYVDTPVDVLKARWAEEKDAAEVFPVELYERTLETYEQVLRLYPHVVKVDGTKPPGFSVRSAVKQLKELCRKA